ncbi:MAG TPA: AraC family transcriptional regulator [Dongiaceae bacterium]|nr:AraC family transcriptional regulator [Dongiaceae bacterium]
MAEFPAQGEWFAIRFKLGSFMPHLRPGALRDRNDVALPDAASRSFWLKGSAWDYPTFENAETFVRQLAEAGLVAEDRLVGDLLRGPMRQPGSRTQQRRFLEVTGLTRGAIRQIERARHATLLLRHGVPILDAAFEAGYYDQPHFTRSLKRWIGQTPAQIVRGERQLSFLYKTEFLRSAMFRSPLS